MNTAATALSPNKATIITIDGLITLSWSESLFFSTVKNYILNTMTKTKLTLSGTKFVLVLPIPCVEWTSNRIFGFIENIVVDSEILINTTEAYRLHEGPKLKNTFKFKKPLCQLDCR